ncbi:MAG: NAD(P)/FAD-dependent oxidoreductase [Fusobacteriota bacterium]
MKEYDVIIIGGGPAGIFTAYELKKQNQDIDVVIIEKGKDIYKRLCPKTNKDGECAYCDPCSITTGWAGAGAYSDGKLSLSHEVGGNLPEYIGVEKTQEMISYVDEIYLDFGATKEVHGEFETDEMQKIRKKSIEANLKLIHCPVRHLGTEKTQKLYTKLYEYLKAQGVEVIFETMVKNFIIEDNEVKGVITKEEDKYYGKSTVATVGREGSEWLMDRCKEHNMPMKIGTVDIGVRVECRNEIMKEINENLYEGKMIHYTKTFDDKVRTFCSNPGGFVSSEYYDDKLAVVNGHSYKDRKSDNTNFALLVSKNFTEPFKSPIEYGKHIAKLANMLTENKILVQRFGDLIRGRRTYDHRLYRNNIIPTLKDAVPGDLSLVLPHRILMDLIEMIYALDNVTPGIASDETLLYGVEVKFYSNIVKVRDNFESSSLDNLFLGGDGAGITRGLMQSSVNGVLLARNILKKLNK